MSSRQGTTSPRNYCNASMTSQLAGKEEANWPFSQRFEALGVQEDTRNRNETIRRPSDKNIEKLWEVLATVTDNVDQLTDRNDYEKGVGLVFASKFISHGAILCNFLFVCMATDPYTKHDVVMVTKDGTNDAKYIYNATI